MSEEHSTDETRETKDTPPISRRSFVKAGGAATLGLGFGVGSAAASSSKAETDIDIQQVSGREEAKAITVAQQSSEFRTLRDYIKENKGEIADSSSALAFKTTDENGDPYTVVSFNKKEGKSQEKTDINIALALRNEKILTAQGTRTIFKEDKPETIQAFDIQNEEVIEESKKVGSPDDEMDTKITLCGYCKEMKRAACVVGCGAGTGAICLFMSLAPPAGVACAAVAAAVCYALDRLDGCKTHAQYACYTEGYCSSPT